MDKVKVRIAVAIDPSGDWSSAGWKGSTDDNLVSSCIDMLDHGERVYWLECELDPPRPIVVEPKVEEG